MVHDLIPVTHPEFCRPSEERRHKRRIDFVLSDAKCIITNSRATQSALEAYAQQRGVELPACAAIHLGVSAGMIVANTFAPPRAQPSPPSFLMLGTLEPRKNHLLILDVWERMFRANREHTPSLIIIGQWGWQYGALTHRLDQCLRLKVPIRLLRRCDDNQVKQQLQVARALLFPSLVEGFGLPLLEALARGTPVIASDLAVFREVAAEIPEYIDPGRPDHWMEVVKDYASPVSALRTSQMERMKCFKPPTWETHFGTMRTLIAVH